MTKDRKQKKGWFCLKLCFSNPIPSYHSLPGSLSFVLFFLFALSLSTSSMSSRTGWTLWSSRSTQTWPFPAPLCPSRTSRYPITPPPHPLKPDSCCPQVAPALWSACSNPLGPHEGIIGFIATVSVKMQTIHCHFYDVLRSFPSFCRLPFFHV